MARKVEVTLIDDIDGTSAERTVEFSIDGTSYEIDLSEANITKLKDAMAEFVENARRTGARKSAARRTGRTPASGVGSPKDVRAWAAKQGHEISARGRIPAEIQNAYDAAH